jgi:hypothetical protein
LSCWAFYDTPCAVRLHAVWPQVACVLECVRLSDRLLDLLSKVVLGLVNPQSSVQAVGARGCVCVCMCDCVYATRVCVWVGGWVVAWPSSRFDAGGGERGAGQKAGAAPGSPCPIRAVSPSKLRKCDVLQPCASPATPHPSLTLPPASSAGGAGQQWAERGHAGAAGGGGGGGWGAPCLVIPLLACKALQCESWSHIDVHCPSV